MSDPVKKIYLISVLVLAALASLSPVTMASGDAAAGQAKATTCESCHGKDGNSVDPKYPNLAGQHESYLVKALSDYRSGTRTNAIMGSFAKPLSNQDILDLAAWYASQVGLEDLSDE